MFRKTHIYTHTDIVETGTLRNCDRTIGFGPEHPPNKNPTVFYRYCRDFNCDRTIGFGPEHPPTVTKILQYFTDIAGTLTVTEL